MHNLILATSDRALINAEDPLARAEELYGAAYASYLREYEATTPAVERLRRRGTGGDTGTVALFKDPAPVEQMLPALRITVAIGRGFCCVLPGHEERHPSATVSPTSLLYIDHHHRSDRPWYTLPAVFAAQQLGQVIDLVRTPDHAVWAERLARLARLA